MMSHHLNDLEIASISQEALQKLQEAEKEINRLKGGNRTEEIYLLALTKRGR